MRYHYPSLERKIETLLYEKLSQIAESRYPILAKSKRLIIHEGDKSTYDVESSKGNTIQKTNIKTISSSASFTDDELKNGIPLPVLMERMFEVFKEMAMNRADCSIQDLIEQMEKFDRNINVGPILTPDGILKALGDLSISFDHKGQPQLPDFMVGSMKFEEVKAAVLKLSEEPYKSRFDTIIAIKKKEHDAREGSRKLVG